MEHRVVDWSQAQHIITACSYSPDARLCLAGLYRGSLLIFDNRQSTLQYLTQLECKNKQGKHRDGRKITGVEVSKDGKLCLVSTNDSRCRVFSLEDFSLISKLRGAQNETLQLRARFFYSDRTQPQPTHVLSGSDDDQCFLWSLPSTQHPQQQSRSWLNSDPLKNDCWESFKCHVQAVTTNAIIPVRSSGAMPAAAAASETDLLVVCGIQGEIKVYAATR